MQNLIKPVTLFLFLFIMVSGCGRSGSGNWNSAIPANTPFVVIPQENMTIAELLNEPYMPLFDDISTSAIQVTARLQEDNDVRVTVKAILLYPDTSTDWQPVWITESIAGLMDVLTNRYQMEFAQNNYGFLGHTVEKLFISNRTLFVVDLGNWMLVSESSLGIEDALRAYSGKIPSVRLSVNELDPGAYVFNFPHMERWIHQMAQVAYRPQLMDIFDGATPLVLKKNAATGNEVAWQLSGMMPLETQTSTLIRSVSSTPRTFTLDRYISSNASAFTIQYLQPRLVPSQDDEPVTDTDVYLSQNLEAYRNIATTLGSEVAFAAFAESGFLSTSEYMFLRHVRDAQGLRRALNALVQADQATVSGGTYFIRSAWIAALFGPDIAPMNDFYLSIHGEAAVIARRRGLAETVSADANRRRVMFYDDQYTEVRNNLPEQLSSLVYVDSPRFSKYIQQWLNPQNYFNAISSNVDLLTIATTRQSDNTAMRVLVTAFNRETTDAPFREQWVFPLGGAEISGIPVLADIGGSSRDEIIFSTSSGSVYALAADGTIVMQVSTSPDTPIGSPLVYDWYGNNQNIIMQAAGSKIYAWNENGTLLPSFPVQLPETITTPLQVMDVTRNGVAEMIVATANRQLHILNSRGEAINGWPQITNAVITKPPVIRQYQNQLTAFAFSENALHAWNVSGNRRSGFPQFISAQFSGSPAFYDSHILGAGSDGQLIAIGNEPLFTDSLAVTFPTDSLVQQGLAVSNSSLNTTPAIYRNIMVRVDEELIREDMVLLQSSNGSVFLYNTKGELRFNQNMGQPGSDNYPPVILDINRNNRQNIVALAGFGRLYAWDLISGERLFELPTTGITYPLITDLNRDGNMQLIANTREGLRAWTIFRSSGN
jgi:hypothetical protein